jgi:hypothetical protein
VKRFGHHRHLLYLGTGYATCSASRLGDRGEGEQGCTRRGQGQMYQMRVDAVRHAIGDCRHTASLTSTSEFQRDHF